MTTQVSVPTPLGEARLWTDEAKGDHLLLRCVLGHGAGAGPDVPDLAALARSLPSAGVSVVRIEQPWRVAGKRVAPAPPRLDEAWLAALEAVPRDVPLVVGGRSAGARVACRTAGILHAAGVLALSFPLHPPGKLERSRLDELSAAADLVPILVVQGERDPFGHPGEFPAGRYDLAPVPHADHSMKVAKAHDPQQALTTVVDAVIAWLAALSRAVSD